LAKIVTKTRKKKFAMALSEAENKNSIVGFWRLVIKKAMRLKRYDTDQQNEVSNEDT
jgi:hypothetical protein